MSFEQILDITMELPLSEREYLVDILSKRIIEDKRKELASFYKDVKEQFDKGEIKPMPFDSIIDELEIELK